MEHRKNNACEIVIKKALDIGVPPHHYQAKLMQSQF